MSKPVKCTSCQQEIPVGKYYELWENKGGSKEGDYCSLCWKKMQIKYEPLIKQGMFKVLEREREREREQTSRNKANLQPKKKAEEVIDWKKWEGVD